MTTETAGRRILIVDDDRGIRHALGTLLEDAGHTVTQAADGPEALSALADQTIDLMLLDVGLPGMSGLDVLAHVRTLTAPPRVVVITADDTPETLLKAVRGQADRYITKPFAPMAIVDVVAEVLAKGPRRSCRSRSYLPGRTGSNSWRPARSKWPTASRRS